MVRVKFRQVDVIVIGFVTVCNRTAVPRAKVGDHIGAIVIKDKDIVAIATHPGTDAKLSLPIASQSMIELSRTQDEEVGDGTTSVIATPGNEEEAGWVAAHLGAPIVEVPAGTDLPDVDVLVVVGEDAGSRSTPA